MRWDKPSTGDGGDRGSDREPGRRPFPGRPDWPHRPARGNPDIVYDRPGEAGEGTGWPRDSKPDKPKSREELEAENKSLRSENARLTGSYERSLQELKRRDNELSAAKMELANTRNERSRLIDTNAALVRDNVRLRDKTARSPAIYDKATGKPAQTELAEKKPRRKNWFPTDKVTALGGAAVTAAGTYAVMVGRAGSKEEAFAVACAGVGLATLVVGREVTGKINGWRDKQAEKKNADRQQG